MKTKFNNFNMLLIILIILGVVGISGAAYYYGLKETTPVPPISQNGTSAATNINLAPSQQASPSVATEIVWPTNETLNAGVSPTSSPAEQPSPSVSQTPPTTEQPSGIIGNQILDKYLKAGQGVQTSRESYKEVSFKATIYQPLPLRDFINGLNIQIYPAIYQYLDQTNYRAVFCYRAPNLVDKGFVFRFRQPSQIADYRKIYDEIGTSLPEWEKTVLSDLGNALFPESSPKSAPKFQEMTYTSKSGTSRSEVRYATAKDQNGNNLFIGYTDHSERIFLANSQKCLENILDAYEITPEKF